MGEHASKPPFFAPPPQMDQSMKTLSASTIV